MIKHPCVKECPNRSTYCKLSCEKFRNYEEEKKLEYQENKDRIIADRGHREYTAQRHNEAFKRWCIKKRYV